MKKRNHSTIAISCEGRFGSGLDWVICVEFRPLSRGFSVWLYESNAIEKNPRWKKIHHSNQLLDWRQACQFILENTDLRVRGDFWDTVMINGLPTWAIALAKCIFIDDEESSLHTDAIGRLGLCFTDEEIQVVLREVAKIPPNYEDEDALASYEALEIIAQAADKRYELHDSLANIKQKMQLPSDASLIDISSKIFSQEIDAIVRSILDAPNESTQSWKEIATRDTLWNTLLVHEYRTTIDHRIQLIKKWISYTVKPKESRHGTELPFIEILLTPPQMILPALMAEDPVIAARICNEILQRGKQLVDQLAMPVYHSSFAMFMMVRPHHRSIVSRILKIQAVMDELNIPYNPEYRIQDSNS